jgi:putative endonuclease
MAHRHHSWQGARLLGERGEDAAAAWYVHAGYRIVDRNWRCREGEIDVIATNGDTVVFCEVKSRASSRFADPATAVDHRKQAKVRRAAFRWLEDQPWKNQLRFDVAVVVSGRVEVIEDAF